MKRQARLTQFAVAMALFAGLSGCASLGWFTPEPEETLACYWMTPDGASWEAMPELATKAACFQMDSCNGGEGVSRGGCYKWAAGSDAPGKSW